MQQQQARERVRNSTRLIDEQYYKHVCNSGVTATALHTSQQELVTEAQQCSSRRDRRRQDRSARRKRGRRTCAVHSVVCAAQRAESQVYFSNTSAMSPLPDAYLKGGIGDDGVRPHVTVSSAAGIHRPLQVQGVYAVGNAGERVQVETIFHKGRPEIVDDSGAGMTVVGYDSFMLLQQHCPGSAVRVEPLETSVRGIRGVGNTTKVEFHCQLTLDLGGFVIRVVDAAVVKYHRGILLGNEINYEARASILYGPSMVDGQYGDATISFGCVDGTFRGDRLLCRCLPDSGEGAVNIAEPTDREDDAGGKDAEDIQHSESEEIAPSPESCVPIAYAPSSTVVPKWSESFVWCRVPKAAIEGHDIAILPLEDERYGDLGVLVAPSVQTPVDGYVRVRVINTSQRPVSIPVLAPMARFIVDPTIAGTDLEFTVEEIVSQVNTDDTITAEDRAHLIEMLSTRRRLFSTLLGWAHGFKMSIETPRIDSGDAAPPALPNRKRSPEETEALKSGLQKLIKNKIIQPICSPYNAMAVPIKKPDGTYRVVQDFRALNLLTVKDSYPLPDVEGNLARLGEANYFTTIDLLMGFHQCEISEESIPKTAFGTPMGQMAFTRMPMGLTSSPGTFMRLVDAALKGLPPGIAIAYCDDIIIPTKGTFAEHMRDVGKVFDKLIEAGFTVRADKVHIGRRQVPYLGFQVGEYGTRPLPEKINAVLSNTISAIGDDPARASRFAGVMGVYHKFLPHLHTILAPFHRLKQKGAPTQQIMRSLAFKAAHATLLRELTCVTALARPDYNKDFHVWIDSASTAGVGAILTQQQKDGDDDSHRPVAIRSHRFDRDARGLPITQQECMGLVDSVLDWRHYLLGAKVHVRTDHASLRWLLSTRHREGTNVQNWALKVQQFDMQIGHVPGVEMVADFFSREGAAATGEGERAGGGIAAEDARIDKVMDASVAIAVTSTSYPHNEDTTTSSRVVALAMYKDAGDAYIVVEDQYDGGLTLPNCYKQYGTSRRATLLQHLGADAREWLQCATPFTPPRQEIRQRSTYFVSTDYHTLNSGRTLPLSHDLIAKMAHPCDRRVLTDALEGALDNKASWYMPVRVRHVMRSMPAAHIYAIAEEQLGETGTALPTIEKHPDGPAFVNQESEYNFIAERMNAQLMQQPGAPIAADCEGSLGSAQGRVELMQFCVDGVPQLETKQLTYVVDTLDRKALSRQDAVSLRAILQNGEIPKVFHCLSGDASTLYKEYGIELQGAFDTGVADCIITGRSTVRRLDRTLNAYLDNVHLAYKGELEYFPGMFAQRPLPEHLFRYSYEDVTNCNRLYVRQRELLEELGYLELVQTITQQRCPPFTVPYSPKMAVGPKWLAIALTDGVDVILFKNKREAPPSLPSAQLSDTSSVKQQGRELWAAVMGEPPRPHVKMAINAKLRKGIRVGPYILAIAVVPDCKAEVEGLQEALRATGRSEGTVGAFNMRQAASVLDKDQLAVVQQARHTMERARQGQREADVSVVSGPVNSGSRAAVLLHDARSVLLVRTFSDKANAASEWYGLPVHNIEVSSTAIAAATRALDLYLGPAIRKGGLQDTVSPLALAPVMAHRVAQACRQMRELCTEGDTTYVACEVTNLFSQTETSHDWDQLHGRELCVTQARHGVLPSFLVAVRRVNNGLRLTPTAEKRYGHADDLPQGGLHVCQHGDMTSKASPADLKALAQLATEMQVAQQHTQSVQETEQQIRRQALHLERQRWRAPDEYISAVDRQYTRLAEIPESQSPQHEQAQVLAAQHTATAGASKARHRWARLYRQYILDRIVTYWIGFANANIGTLHRLATGDLHIHRTNNHCFVQQSGIWKGLVRKSRPVSPVLVAEALEWRDIIKSSNNYCDSVPRYGEDPEFDALVEARVMFAFLQCTAKQATVAQIQSATVNKDNGPYTYAQIAQMQRQHRGLRRIIEAKKAGAVHQVIQQSEEDTQQDGDDGLADLMHYKLGPEGVLLRIQGARELIVAPPIMHRRILKAYHDNTAHLGVEATYDLIRRRFYWDTPEAMRACVSDYVAHCDPCQRAKVPNRRAGEGHIHGTGEHPYDSVAVDEYTVGMDDDGYDHITTFACYFSRNVTAAATRGSIDSEALADLLMDLVVRRYGVPRDVFCDHGTVMVSKMIRAFYKKFEITLHASAAYHHNSIGLVERWHQCLKQILRCWRVGRKDVKWREYLPVLELCYNSVVHRATGFSPFFIINGRDSILPADLVLGSPPKDVTLPDYVQRRIEQLGISYDAVAQKLLVNALHRKREYDLKRDTRVSFRPGDRVYLIKGLHIDKNLQKSELPTHEEPYIVQRVLADGNYQLMDMRNRRMSDVVNLERLRPAPLRKDYADAENDEGAVDCITSHRQRTRKDGAVEMQYRIKWRGIGLSEWRAAHELEDIPSMVEAYRRRAGLAKDEAPTPAVQARDVRIRANAEDLIHTTVTSPHRPGHTRMRRTSQAEGEPEEHDEPLPDQEVSAKARTFQVERVLDVVRRGRGFAVQVAWHKSWTPFSQLAVDVRAHIVRKFIGREPLPQELDSGRGTWGFPYIKKICAIREPTAQIAERAALVEWQPLWQSYSTLTEQSKMDALALLDTKERGATGAQSGRDVVLTEPPVVPSSGDSREQRRLERARQKERRMTVGIGV